MVMKKALAIILCMLFLFLVACEPGITFSESGVTSSESDNLSSEFDAQAIWEKYKKEHPNEDGIPWEISQRRREEAMKNKTLVKISTPLVERFLHMFPLEYAYFDLVPVYRFNYYGNSRIAIIWDHTEAVFNCSIIDDEELINRLKKVGYSEVKSFNKETKFAWDEFKNDFVDPIYFEQKYVAEDVIYGSKTYYNKIVICKPFNNTDAQENEKVVFFDLYCNNRDPYYEEVIKTIDDRPVTEILNTSKEWRLIEPK